MLLVGNQMQTLELFPLDVSVCQLIELLQARSGEAEDRVPICSVAWA